MPIHDDGEITGEELKESKRQRARMMAAENGHAAGAGSLDPLDGRMRFKHNPAHACGTCADCGGEMVWNVPRMGPAGGFVHKGTGKFECNSPIVAICREEEGSK